MRCPKCEREFGGPVLNHLKECSIDPQRLFNVGIIDLEELESINRYNDKGDAETSPSSKHN